MMYFLRTLQWRPSFWRAGRSGYTTDLTQAHLFTREEAEAKVRGAPGHSKMVEAVPLLADAKRAAARRCFTLGERLRLAQGKSATKHLPTTEPIIRPPGTVDPEPT